MEGSSIGNSAKTLDLADFSKSAQRAQTKGAKDDSLLQLSKDGEKVYFSHHRSGLKLQLTKLACTLTNFFGYDLKARVGVQPNESRQAAAAQRFALAVKDLDPSLNETFAAVRNYDLSDENQGLKVSEFKEFDLQNPVKVIAYNKIVAEQFVMPEKDAGKKNDKLEAIMEKLNIDSTVFTKNDFARSVYSTLLNNVAKNDNQLLTTKDLRTRLEDKLYTFKFIVAMQAENEDVANKLFFAEHGFHIDLSNPDTALENDGLVNDGLETMV